MAKRKSPSVIFVVVDPAGMPHMSRTSRSELIGSQWMSRYGHDRVVRYVLPPTVGEIRAARAAKVDAMQKQIDYFQQLSTHHAANASMAKTALEAQQKQHAALVAAVERLAAPYVKGHKHTTGDQMVARVDGAIAALHRLKGGTDG